jgi:hypothetical protein
MLDSFVMWFIVVERVLSGRRVLRLHTECAAGNKGKRG